MLWTCDVGWFTGISLRGDVVLVGQSTAKSERIHFSTTRNQEVKLIKLRLQAARWPKPKNKSS